MEKRSFEYINSFKSCFSEINRENLETFDFPKIKRFKEIKNNLFNNLPYDLFEIMNEYSDLIIEFVSYIRKEDCFKVFVDGLMCGIEFERYLKDKNEQ